MSFDVLEVGSLDLDFVERLLLLLLVLGVLSRPLLLLLLEFLSLLLLQVLVQLLYLKTVERGEHVQANATKYRTWPLCSRLCA